MASNSVDHGEIIDSPINQSVTSTGSDEIYNSTLLNTSSGSPPKISVAPSPANRLAVNAQKNKRRSFSPYKFPLRTPEISPIEKQLADISLIAAPQSRKFLTPKAPRDQFVTVRVKHGAAVVKKDTSLKEKKGKTAAGKIRNKSMVQLKVSPNTLFTSPSENGGSDKSNGSIRSVSGQDMSSSEIMEQTLCVESILKDLSLQKYLDIFVAEEIDFQVFLTLDKKDLLEIGLTDEKDMEKILQTIKCYLNNSIHVLTPV